MRITYIRGLLLAPRRQPLVLYPSNEQRDPVGFRATGTFDTLFLLVGFIVILFTIWAATIAFGLLGFTGTFGPLVLVLYLRHPRRREHEELDEKLPMDRWDHGRTRYIEEVKKRIVEDQDHP